MDPKRGYENRSAMKSDLLEKARKSRRMGEMLIAKSEQNLKAPATLIEWMDTLNVEDFYASPEEEKENKIDPNISHPNDYVDQEENLYFNSCADKMDEKEPLPTLTVLQESFQNVELKEETFPSDMKIPMYSQNQGLSLWFKKYDRKCSKEKWTEKEKKENLMNYFEDPIFSWIQMTVEEYPLLGYAKLKKELIDLFAPAFKPQGKNEATIDYALRCCDAFLQNNIEEQDRVQFCIDGLKDELREKAMNNRFDDYRALFIYLKKVDPDNFFSRRAQQPDAEPAVRVRAYNQDNEYRKKCFSCGSTDHLARNCPVPENEYHVLPGVILKEYGIEALFSSQMDYNYISLSLVERLRLPVDETAYIPSTVTMPLCGVVKNLRVEHKFLHLEWTCEAFVVEIMEEDFVIGQLTARRQGLYFDYKVRNLILSSRRNYYQ